MKENDSCSYILSQLPFGTISRNQFACTIGIVSFTLSAKMNETVFDENETSNKKVVSQREVSTAVDTLGAFLQVCAYCLAIKSDRRNIYLCNMTNCSCATGVSASSATSRTRGG